MSVHRRHHRRPFHSDLRSVMHTIAAYNDAEPISDSASYIGLQQEENESEFQSATGLHTMNHHDAISSSSLMTTTPTVPTTHRSGIDPSSAATSILYHFMVMSLLFSSNHGCVVACLSLATARLGSFGAYQNGLLYVTYAISGLIGSTYVVKELGSRNALAFGMGLYCVYVLTFYVATNITQATSLVTVVTVGALVGGWGAGFLWTAQGAYFTRAAQLYHHHNIRSSSSSSSSLENSTAKLASIFAFIYLSSEIGLRAISTFALDVLKLTWSNLFAFYATVAVLSTLLMSFVQKLPDEDISVGTVATNPTDTGTTHTSALPTTSIWYKATAAWRLLVQDPKMKYMIGLNAVFGLTSSFLTSYVNGTVVRNVLGSDTYVGLLTAWISCVAAVSSAVFGYVASTTIRKGYVLMMGSLCFLCVAGSFILFPHVSSESQQWTWWSLVAIYTLHGIGRATFEGTLKSTFADYFSYEKEGAFANIILQNGLSSALGFALTFTLHCSTRKQEMWGPYCVMNKDGSVHDVLTFELLIVIAAFVAIYGYYRASVIRTNELSRIHYENIPTTIL